LILVDLRSSNPLAGTHGRPGWMAALRHHRNVTCPRSPVSLPCRTMPNEALLIGIAQLAVVIAGFTAITAALTPPGGSWSPAHRIRQRAIVSTSFNVMFESLLPLIIFAALQDARTAMVWASAAVALYVVFVITFRARQLTRAGAFRTRGVQLMFGASLGSLLLFASNAVVFGSVAVYALALCLQLSVAAMSFYTLVASASS